MSYVNPYLNIYGWGLTVTERNNNTWESDTLLTADTITLTLDQSVSNIWDPMNRRLLAWGNQQNNIGQNIITGNNIVAVDSSTLNPAWNIPDPNQAGDISQVNVIINNNTDSYYIIWTGSLGIVSRNGIVVASGQIDHIIPGNQSVGLNLKLGPIYMIKLVGDALVRDSDNIDINKIETILRSAMDNGNIIDINHSTIRNIRTDLRQIESDILSSIIRFQIFPVPDQIISIGNTSTTISSNILKSISLNELHVHNCYDQPMYIKQRPCDWTSGQNMALIHANTSIKLQVYNGYQIYLQTPNSSVISGLLKYPRSCRGRKIYFKSNGELSTESCVGKTISSTCDIPVYIDHGNNKNDNFTDWWKQWWWAVLIGVIVIILLIILIIYIGRKDSDSVEIYD